MRNYTKPEIKKIELETIDIIQVSQMTQGGENPEDLIAGGGNAGWASANVYDIQ